MNLDKQDLSLLTTLVTEEMVRSKYDGHTYMVGLMNLRLRLEEQERKQG